jgi:hypothetical protein
MQTLNHSLLLTDTGGTVTDTLPFAGVWARLESSEATDAEDQMKQAERADWVLLRLVLCAASATMLLALACSLGL